MSNWKTKKEASDILGVTKQWMNYRTKKKGGVSPAYVSADGTLVDIENKLLLNYVEKQKNKVEKKVVRGKAPQHEIERKELPVKKQAKNSIKKSVDKKPKAPKVSDLPNLSEEELEQKEMSELIAKAERAKCEQEIFKAEKMNNELKASRNELVSRSAIGDTVFGYLDNLSKEIMQLPVQIIQEMRAGIEAGKSNIELIDDLRKPLTVAIQNTKKTIQKRLNKN